MCKCKRECENCEVYGSEYFGRSNNHPDLLFGDDRDLCWVDSVDSEGKEISTRVGGCMEFVCRSCS